MIVDNIVAKDDMAGVRFVEFDIYVNEEWHTVTMNKKGWNVLKSIIDPMFADSEPVPEGKVNENDL